MIDRPPCSVILPTRDRPAQLDRALATVTAALGPHDELVVVDSASQDGSVSKVAQDHGARVVRCAQPGVNRARNAGWRATTHDALLYLDDDVLVDAGWADALVAALGDHPDAGFVSGRIDVPDDVQPPIRPVAIKDDTEATVLTAKTAGVLGHSASLAVRRQSLAEVGGWDEALGAGGRFKSAPEVDLFDRLFAAGWVGWYEPAARARHEQWRSKRDLVALDWRYGYGSGARIAKLLRTDRHRAALVAREVFWTQGIRDGFRNAVRGYKTPALLKGAHVSGATAGLCRGLTVPVVNGHFAIDAPSGSDGGA